MAQAKKKSKEAAWLRHEILTKVIYKALLDQDHVKNLVIEQNVKIRGTHSFHQIDVYWKFYLAGVEYITIVQVKKEKRPATQGDIHTLEGVLKDLSGQPRGVFVTQAGYQSGALNHAKGVGIILVQLSEAPADSSFTMTSLSQANMELLPDALAMRVTVYHTKVTHVSLAVDEVWASEKRFSMPTFQPFSITSLDLINDSGQSQDTLHDRVQYFVKSNRSGGELRLEFSEPTYLLGLKPLDQQGSAPVQIKLVRMILLVDVKEEVRMNPLSYTNFVTYMLHDLIKNDQRYVMVERDKEEPQVILSLPHLKSAQPE